MASPLYWATTYPFRLACLATPLLYWFFGITVVNAPVAGVVGHFLPYLLAVLVAANWTSGGLVVPVLNDVGQVLGAKEITKAVAIGLARPKGHKFKVTAKGGDRDRVVVQWPLLRPLLALFALTVAGLLFSPVTGVVFDRDAGDGKWVILFWTFYNLVVLGVAMAVCVEPPRAGTSARVTPERAFVHAGGGGNGGLADAPDAVGRLAKRRPHPGAWRGLRRRDRRGRSRDRGGGARRGGRHRPGVTAGRGAARGGAGQTAHPRGRHRDRAHESRRIAPRSVGAALEALTHSHQTPPRRPFDACRTGSDHSDFASEALAPDPAPKLHRVAAPRPSGGAVGCEPINDAGPHPPKLVPV